MSSRAAERDGGPLGSERRYPVSSAAPHLSVAERVARGRAARREVPRSSHAVFEPTAHRLDPIELLERQADMRVPELVPIRYGRMLASPFTFYRGAALIMAADLAATPRSGSRCSAAAMLTSRTSACTRRLSGDSSSTSTTSTRRCPVRGNGTSSVSR